MENNTIITEVETTPATETTATPTDDVVTMSKGDYDKVIQSTEDKIRGKLSKEIKSLQDKIAEMTPATKSEAELELENRLATLEAKEKETAEKERLLSLRETLQGSGIDQSLADYLRADVDTQTLIEALDKVVSGKIKAAGYQPTGHQSNTSMSKEEYNKLPYSEKVALYKTDPELVKKFRN